jgi:hypothetical protein
MMIFVTIVARHTNRHYPPFNGTSYASIYVLPAQNHKQIEFVKTTEEIQRFMSPLADMDSLESPKVCHDAYTHFTVSLVSSDLGYVYKLVYGLLGFDIIRSCRRCNAKD